MLQTLLIIGSATDEQYEPVRLEMIRDGIKPEIIRLDVRELQMDVIDWLSSGNSVDTSWAEPYVDQCGSTYGIIFESDDRRIEFEELTYMVAENDAYEENDNVKVFAIQRNGDLKIVLGASIR